jgi:hypothetical protein
VLVLGPGPALIGRSDPNGADARHRFADKSAKETGPARGTFSFSPPIRSALSGVNKDRTQNITVPTNVRRIRLTCAAVSSLALTMASAGSLQRPWRLRRFNSRFFQRAM